MRWLIEAIAIGSGVGLPCALIGSWMVRSHDREMRRLGR